MRTKTVTAIVLALVVVTLPAVVGISFHAPTDEPLKVDSPLVGKEATNYIAEKALREPAFAAFLRTTETELSAKGWTRFPAADAVLLRKVKPRQPGRIAKAIAYILGLPLQAQDASTSSGDGEMVWAGWHDGDWNTWEGGVWVRDYVVGDTWSFNMQFDYHNSTDGVTPVFETWMGAVDWRDREGRPRVSLGRPQGFLAKIDGKLCPVLEAQASDGLPCDAPPRLLTSAFMRQAFSDLANNAGWVLGSAAAAGLMSGSAAFFPTLGGAAWGILMDSYLREFRRFYGRC